MACWIESNRGTVERRAAWHRDCVAPHWCPCPGHRAEAGCSEPAPMPSAARPAR